jgi:hypothetical protein
MAQMMTLTGGRAGHEVAIDLTRCQARAGYLPRPDVFRMHDDEALRWSGAPAEARRRHEAPAHAQPGRAKPR